VRRARTPGYGAAARPEEETEPEGAAPPAARAVFVAAFRGLGEADEPTELKLGVPHALKLMNESYYNTGVKVVDRVRGSAKAPTDAVEQLFLAVLSRRPTADERAKFGTFVEKQKSPRDAYCRVVWVLRNRSEFMLNR
jgi:hypothetical protein